MNFFVTNKRKVHSSDEGFSTFYESQLNSYLKRNYFAGTNPSNK
jgi:hypothetical protein